MIENVITSRVDIQGYENIKQLKDAITALRSEMKGLEAGSEKYKETADELVRAEYDLKQAMIAQKKDNSSLKGSYNDLVNQMAALKKVWRETTDESIRADYGAQINALNNELKALDATTGNYQRNVGDYKNQLKLAKAELATMTKGTAEYNAQLAKCAQIQHDFTEQQTLIKNSAADLGDQLANVTNIGSGMASGFAALNSLMGLLGKDTENYQEALLKVQQTMALVQGLQGLEGMWKKCEQLSVALGLVKATTVETTVATQAEAATMAAAGTAVSAEAVATEGATVAQRGLNAAMKANPIGIIITAVMVLVGLFVTLKDKFKELINSNDESAKKFDNLKAVLTGVGDAIKKFVMLPIKNTITLFKTLGKTMKAVFTGEWGSIKDIVKEGSEELKKNIDEAMNSYKEGYTEKLNKLDEERSRKKAEQDAKDLQETIKNNEAKYGSDWKYTQDGKKIYDEYLKNKIASYKKDSEEYRQAVRDKDEYDRLYNEKMLAADKKRADEAEATSKKIQQEWETMMKNNLQTEVEKARDEIKEMVRIWNDEMGKIGRDDFKIDINAQHWYKSINNGFVDPLEEKFKEMPEDVKKRFMELLKTNAFDAVYKQQLELLTKSDNLYKKFADNQRDKYKSFWTMHGEKDMEQELKLEETLYERRTSNAREAINNLTELSQKMMPTEGLASEAVAMRKIIEEQLNPFFEKYYGDLNDAEIEYFNKRSEIRMSYLQEDQESVRKWRDDQIKDNELLFQSYESSVSKYGFKAANVFTLESQMIEDNYNIQESAITKTLENLYKVLGSNELVVEDRKNVIDQIYQYENELEDLQLEHTIETNRLRMESNERLVNTIKDSAQGTSDLLGKWADGYKMVIDAQVNNSKKLIENEYKVGKITKEVYDNKMAAVDASAEKEFETVKDLQVAQATVNMLSAAIGAYQSLASIPYVGPALGAAAAATALAYGGAQIAQIKATQYGSSSSTNGSTTPTQVTPAIDDYNPTRVSNITGAMETENLANAMRSTPLWISVVDIDRAQDRVKIKDQETTF